MLPFLGQGAAMAMEDAVVLARAIEAVDNVTKALVLYQDTRQARTAWAQLESREAGHRFHEDQVDNNTISHVWTAPFWQVFF
jgi:salicylate hydroxylase